MNELNTAVKPSKLIPVLIGGGAMTVVSIVPLINWINCACCAGIMGTAVLGVWFYKKSFPEDMAFTVGDGVTVGALSGLVAAPLTTILQFLMLGLASADFSMEMQDQIDQAFAQAETQATDPAAVEAAREVVMQLASTPLLLFAVALIFSLIIFVGFGALGGVIGGNIFKTKIVPAPPAAN
jgi:pheromone shutdown protein TraB